MGSTAIRAGGAAIAMLAFCGIVQAAQPANPRLPAPFRAPRDAVVALYRLSTIPIAPQDKQRFFSGDMTAALIKDSDRDDEVGVANDGDYRYDAQDMKITGLQIGDPSVHGGASVIRVAFRNFGKATTVTYDLCQRRPGDWRIQDVTTPSGGSLRKLLGLVSIRQSKGC
jgi:hypothetical protein